MNELLKNIIKTAEGAQIINENDYKNDDGLLMCGLCNTPKQTRLKEPYDEIIVPVACKCRHDAYNAMQEKKRLDELEKRRNTHIEHEKWRSHRFGQDDGKNSKITHSLRKYCDKFSDMFKKNLSLLLYGPVGTGKTFYAACIANELINQGYSVVMSDLPRIVDYINPYGKNQRKREEYEAHLQYCDLLVIDDLSAERDTDFMKENVYRVINMRYESRKPMIVTTNLSEEQLAATNDEDKRRVYDRIREMCHFICINGESRRFEEAAKRAEKVNKFLELSE